MGQRAVAGGRGRRAVMLAAAACLVVVSCGGDDSSGAESTEAPVATTADAATTAPTATTAAGVATTVAASTTAGGQAALPDGDTSFTIAFPATPGFVDTPLLVTIDELNAAGWDIDTKVINDTGLQTEALASGEIQMTAGNSIPVLKAIQLGVDLVLLGERSVNDWIVVARSDVADCAALAGQNVAYQSEASPSTFMLRTYVDATCGADPSYLIMEGSANRATALVDGQIGATIVQVADWIAATGGDNPDVHILANMGEELDQLITSSYASSRSWATDNEAVLTAFFAALLQNNRDLGDDPAALTAAATDELEGIDTGSLPAIIEAYGDNPFFTDGGLSDERVAYTLTFLEGADAIEPGLTAATVTLRAPLDAAIAELG